MGMSIPGHMGSYALLVVQEVFIGLFVGFLVSVIVSRRSSSPAQYFAVQIGFGINEVIDPLAQVSVPLIGQLKNLIGLLVFLAMNGHHFLIQAIYRSYELAPVMSLGPGASAGLLKFLTHIFSGMFVVALKIALPVMATVFLVVGEHGRARRRRRRR